MPVIMLMLITLLNDGKWSKVEWSAIFVSACACMCVCVCLLLRCMLACVSQEGQTHDCVCVTASMCVLLTSIFYFSLNLLNFIIILILSLRHTDSDRIR